jgi:hypothetical protein
MNASVSYKIKVISIVDYKDHILAEFCDIMEYKRIFIHKNRVFVDNKEKDFLKRTKFLFFSQLSDSNEVMNNILNLRGFASKSKDENIVTLLLNQSSDKVMLQAAAERLNSMYLYDDQNKLVKVKLQ